MLKYIACLKQPNILIKPYVLPKRIWFSQPQVLGHEYKIFVEMNILKILQRLQSAT